MAVRERTKPQEVSTGNESESTTVPKKKRIGKYGWFVIIFTASLVFLNGAALMWKTFSDFYADHIFRFAAETTGRFSGLFPFSLGEVLITLAIVLVLASIALSVLLVFLRKKQKYKSFTLRYLKTMLVIVLSVVLLYTLNCSILYCSTPLSFAGGVREFDIDEFENVRNYVVTQCAELSPKMERKGDGTMVFPESFDNAAADAMRNISGKFPRLAGYYPPAKEIMGSYFMYKSGIIGVYFPFSVEANYSRFVSDSYMPHVLAHEYAHLKGYIYESEANFISYLACINSNDDAVKYSGYLCVLSYIDSDYKNSVPEDRYNAQPQIPDLVRFDNYCYDSETWEYLKKRDEENQPKVAEIAENVSDTLMDSYMDAFDYKPNYSEVTLLMMQYYTEFGGFKIGA